MSMAAHWFLESTKYFSHLSLDCNSKECFCGLNQFKNKAIKALGLCSTCEKSEAIKNFPREQYCKTCLRQAFPLEVGYKVTIENSEGIVVEVEEDSHFVVDILGIKKWFSWWRNWYDITERSMH